MGLKGRFFSQRDMDFINSVNGELLGDIIQTEVTVFKICADVTTTNIYGEVKSSVGVTYYPGIEITALIDRSSISTESDDFGPDRKQDVVFKMREKMLKEINFFPQNGDLILFNARYHEVDNVVQEQFLGGVDDKSHSIIVNTHYSRLTKINLATRQS